MFNVCYLALLLGRWDKVLSVGQTGTFVRTLSAASDRQLTESVEFIQTLRGLSQLRKGPVWDVLEPAG